MDAGAEVFDYGNSLRTEAQLGGFDRAFDYPGFLPAYIRPLFCEGKGPFRWVALSGDPADIAATDEAVLEEFPDDDGLARWIRLAAERVAFQGLPARICWLGYGERHRLGLRFNEMVRTGKVSAPIVIGRDHLDSGSVASPYRETEAMADGSDAIADWPLLNALVNTSSGASWVSIHHGGGVGIGRSIHAGMVCVADGTDLAAEKLARVLVTDPGMGVIRHADAGYERAVDVAERARRAPAHARGRRRMTIRKIATVGHPVLRERARELSPDELASPEMQRLIDDMIETMRDANGAGLAANQVHEPVRIAVIEVDHNPRYPYKPRHPAHRRRQPGAGAAGRRAGRDQRGLPVRSRPARQRHAPRERAGPLPRPARARRTTRSSGASRQGPSSTSWTTSTGCCSWTGSRTRPRSPPGRSSSAGTGPRSSSASPCSWSGSGRDRPVRLWCEWAWLGGPQAEAGVVLDIEGDRLVARGRRRPRRHHPRPKRRRRGSPSPASSTPTPTPSTVRCAAGPKQGGARSGPGATRCTSWPPRSRRTRTAGWPRPPSPRWRWPGSPTVGEFHYLHHGPGRSARTTTPTRWAHALIDAAAEAGRPADAAGHLLPARRHRPGAQRGAAALLGRVGRGVGRAGRSAGVVADGPRGGGRPLGAGGRSGGDERRWRRGRRSAVPPCTRTSASSRPRTTTAVAAYGRTPTGP